MKYVYGTLIIALFAHVVSSLLARTLYADSTLVIPEVCKISTMCVYREDGDCLSVKITFLEPCELYANGNIAEVQDPEKNK